MKLKQKNLIKSLLQTLQDEDEIFKATISFEEEHTNDNGWEIIIKEKPLEEINVWVFFTDIAQLIQTCQSVFSSPNDLLVYGIEPMEENNTLLLRYAIF